MLMKLAARARTGPDRDAGAVAVIVALCTVVLFGIAAMAVDLGNGWSRKRSAQTDADFAALAGAAYLPDTNAARSAAYDYLQRNLPKSDDNADAGPVSNYNDGDLGNGEITFPTTKKIVVWVPKRKVSFGIAAAIGFTAVHVQATATAEIRSPKRLLPFFLNSTCNLGPTTLKDPSNTNPTLEPAGGRNRPTISQMVVAPNPIPSAAGGTLTFTGTNFDPGAASTLRAEFTQGQQHVQGTLVGVPTATTATFSVPAGMTSGVWYVQLFTQAGGWSNDNQNQAPTFTVVATGCGQSATGDFGLLDSPRNPPPNLNGTSQFLDFNLAFGLDHGINCFPGPSYPVTPGLPQYSSCPGGTSPLLAQTVNHNCEVTPQIPIAGGVYDQDPTRDDADCMDINNGLGPSATTQGLIAGGNDAGTAFNGRLTQVTGADGGCHPPGQSNPTTVNVRNNNYTIANDVLSCYLKPGHTLSELLSPNPSPDIVTDALIDSPRFFFVPVLNASEQPQNGFYPILDFRAVFITDESPSTPASAGNGIYYTNSGQNISQITVFAFSLAALPSTAANEGGTIPYIGAGPKIPVLTN